MLYLYCCWELYSVNPIFSANNNASAICYRVMYLLYCHKCVSFVCFDYDFIHISSEVILLLKILLYLSLVVEASLIL